MAFVAVALTACTRMTTGTANSEPARIFPNLDEFTAVNSADYQRLEHWGNTIYFEAPNGIRCAVSAYLLADCRNVPFAITDAEPGSDPAGCTGVEPTVTPSRTSGNTYRFFHRSKPCTSTETDVFRPLPAGNKISLEGGDAPIFTCAVGADLVACIDPDENHGFVLRPTGSWTF